MFHAVEYMFHAVEYMFHDMKYIFHDVIIILYTYVANFSYLCTELFTGRKRTFLSYVEAAGWLPISSNLTVIFVVSPKRNIFVR